VKWNAVREAVISFECRIKFECVLDVRKRGRMLKAGRMGFGMVNAGLEEGLCMLKV
jgi:hypothetical protein